MAVVKVKAFVITLLCLTHTAQSFILRGEEFNLCGGECSSKVGYWDWDSYRMCGANVLTPCFGKRPLCMTTYTKHKGNFYMSKRCASVTECSLLWWDQTRKKKHCLQGKNVSWSDLETEECHFCCQSKPNTGSWCNRIEYPVKPGSLIDMNLFKIQCESDLIDMNLFKIQCESDLVFLPSPCRVSDGKNDYTHVQCEVSECTYNDLNGGATACSPSKLVTCPSDQQYCLNTLIVTPTVNGQTMTVSKRCVSDVECYNDWWEDTRNDHKCTAANLTPSHVYNHGLICRFCCNTLSLDGDVCNLKARPANLVSYAPLPTLPPGAAGARVCVQCGDESQGISCDLFELSESRACLHGLDYCLNHIQRKNGLESIIKRCADKEECLNLRSTLDPYCDYYNPSDPETNIDCYFCCSANGCNQPFVPSEDTMFTNTTDQYDY